MSNNQVLKSPFDPLTLGRAVGLRRVFTPASARGPHRALRLINTGNRWYSSDVLFYSAAICWTRPLRRATGVFVAGSVFYRRL